MCLNLPGWFGVGSAVAAYEAAHGPDGLARLQVLYRDWSFFGTVLDTVELSLAKASVEIAERYAGLATGEDSARIWERLRAEHDLSEAAVLRITGRAGCSTRCPSCSARSRSATPCHLSELQVRLLAALRPLPPGDPGRTELERLVHLTVRLASQPGIQNTG